MLGRPRGFLVQPHVHVGQVERYEVMSRTLKVVENGREHLLGPGETMEVPAGAAHRQLPGDKAQDGHVRVQVRPAGTTQAFLERVADLCAAGQFNRFGFPRAVAGAQIVTEFGDEGHAARPPLAVQKALARLVLRVAGLMRPYVFVDEWDVAAPREAVFAAIADARTYPEWWRPVYLDVDADGPAELGKEARQHFKGRLPYHLHTRSRVVALDAPQHGDRRGRRRPARARDVDADADGDRHPRALRLAGPRRPAAAARAHARPAPGLALEPQLGHRPRHGGPGALRAAHRLSQWAYIASIASAYLASIGLRLSFIVGVSSSPPGSQSPSTMVKYLICSTRASLALAASTPSWTAARISSLCARAVQ